MSTLRSSSGGWVNQARMPKGPGGRPLCRQCGVEVPKGRRTFCSKDCVHRWRVKTDPAYLRYAVFQRDQGCCAACGVDTMKGFKGHQRARGSGHLWQADHIIPVIEGGGECDMDNLRTLCTPCHKKATAELRKRMARTRAVARPLPLFDSAGL